MGSLTLGVLLKLGAGAPPPPEQLPFGRAALALRPHGVEVVFGDHSEDGLLRGFRVVPGGWEPCRARLHAAFDRFGSFSEPLRYARLLEGLGGIPVLNPPRLTAQLRDKLATQTRLGHLGMPALEVDPRRFAAFLAAGPAFLKPRFGSFGRGVERLEVGPVPARAVVDRVDQPLVLQRAVPAPQGYAGISLRILAQRGPDGPIVRSPVARISRTDPVVNRARGADVQPADDLFPQTAQAARTLALQVLAALPEAIEVGVDAVVDPDGHPHLIEVNSRPRGRLAALAGLDPERFGPEHEAAVRAPLETLLRA